MRSDARTLAAVLAKACRLDVIAFKPGNVSLCAPGHAMCAADFFTSARVAVPHLCDARLRPGARMLAAVRATQAAVGCNTNLGIVLLLAPLALAAVRDDAPLRGALAQVLRALDTGDAAQCYAAIRLANPGGLGTAPEADVATAPSLGLRAAMALAADRDSIARQYVEDYADVFDTGVATLVSYRRRWRSLAWATSACYLEFLARWPDSHVVRKHGAGVADTLRRQAAEVATAFKACEDPRSLTGPLKAFDRALKAAGINPGTSADLSVASVAALLIEERSRA